MSSDATPSYRGYRLQALYTLYRILENSPEVPLVFQPEGVEDLAIMDSNNCLKEIIQIKAHRENLTLTSFSPEKPESFFYRVKNELAKKPEVEVTIISFGPIGPELAKCFNGEQSSRCNVANKLSRYGYIERHQAEELLKKIKVLSVNEQVIEKAISERIRETMLGVEPKRAFELLTYWLYVCAEEKAYLSQVDIYKRIDEVGKFIAERKAYQDEWFTSIIPIDDELLEVEERKRLTDEFYQGISARYEHILAGLDSLRPEKLDEISKKFSESRIVIIHGASGQGKSTLAYRFFHNYFPNEWRFKIELIEGREHALKVARALAGHANALRLPVAIYLDVSPSDIGWTELLRQLYPLNNIKILVTIREDDWRRSKFWDYSVDFQDIELSFDEAEAENIYHSVTKINPSPYFISFTDAWERFGGQGPLLEFVYMVTQGASIRQRLKQQIARLEDELRRGELLPNELELLTMVSVASAYGASLITKEVAHYLQLVVPKRTLELFEKEYLLRQSQDGSLIQGLHPIRSELLVELLTDHILNPWVRWAKACIPFINEVDLESFLFYSFSRRRNDADQLLEAIWEYKPKRWGVIAGITKALMWYGISKYTSENMELVKEVYARVGHGWFVVLDFDITNAIPGSSDQFLKLTGMFDENWAKEIRKLRLRQTDKSRVFTYVRKWISSISHISDPPIVYYDWSGMADVLFWMNYLRINSPLIDQVREYKLDAIFELPIDVLADLSFALAFLFPEWYSDNRERLIERLRREKYIIVMEDDGEKVTAHFIVEPGIDKPTSEKNEVENSNKDILHGQALGIIQLIRRIFPERKLYACQGYGHRMVGMDLPFDNTVKTGIPAENLPIPALTWVNSTFIELCDREFRPKDWAEYADLVLGIRVISLQVLASINERIYDFFEGKPDKLIELVTSREYLANLQTIRSPKFPLCVLDEWGIISETKDESSLEDNKENKNSNNPLIGSSFGLSIQKYIPIHKSMRDYCSALSTFFNQIIESAVLNVLINKKAMNREDELRIIESAKSMGMKANYPRLAFINLFNSIKALKKLQEQYRKFFSQYMSREHLHELEQKEKQILQQIFPTCYYFSFHPRRKIKNAKKECTKQLDDRSKAIRYSLNHSLRKIEKNNVQIRVIKQIVIWEEEPTIFITIDGDNPTEVYGYIETVWDILRETFQGADELFTRYALEKYWSRIVIIPLVRGRCLFPLVWSLPTTILVFSKEHLSWWNLIPQSFPVELMNELGVRIWEIDENNIGKELWQGVATFTVMINAIIDITRLPDIDLLGREILEGHIEKICPLLNSNLQLVIDIMTKMLEVVDSRLTTMVEMPTYFYLAFNSLKNLYDCLKPIHNVQGEYRLTLEELIEWTPKLREASSYAFVTCLYWSRYFITADKDEVLC